MRTNSCVLDVGLLLVAVRATRGRQEFARFGNPTMSEAVLVCERISADLSISALLR